MLLRKRLISPANLTRVGLLCFAVAGISRVFLHPAGQMVRDSVDAAEGFFYGLAITTLLFGMISRRRGGASTDQHPCA